MSNNTLIGTTNLLQSATLKNGTGGGAPALEELSPYTMAKAQNSDRYSIWSTSAVPSSPVNVDFDLGSNKTVTAAAMLGFREATFPSVTTLKIYSAPSASGYVPAGWNLQATISVSGQTDRRDFGAVFASVSQRYWRFEFTGTGSQFSAGRLWLGNPTDLGLVSSAGKMRAPFQNRSEIPLPSGAVVTAAKGDPGADFVLPFTNQLTSLRDTLEALSQQTGSILYIDENANFYECLIRGGRVPNTQGYTGIADTSLELTRLP